MRFIKNFFSDIRIDLFHSSLLLSGSLVAQLIAFAAYPVITRLYTPGQFGGFSVFLSITGILAILATGRFEYALMLPEDENEAQTLKKIGLRWCLLFSTGCFLVSLGLGALNIVSIPGFYLLGPYIFLTGSVQIFSLYRNRQKQYKKLAEVSVLQNTAASGGKILFGFLGSLNLGLIWGSIAGQLVSLIAVSKGFLHRSLLRKPENSKAMLQKYSAFPKYRMAQALINAFSSNLPIFFITAYFSARESGYFALILGIGYKIITLVSTALYQVLYRRFTDEKNLGQPLLPVYGKIMLILATVSIVPAIPVFIFSKSLISVFFGPVWLEAATYLKIMTPWLVLVFMVSPFAFILDLFSLQKKGLLYDSIHLLIRIAGLTIGFYLNNVYWAVILFSAFSICYLIFQIIWYFSILNQYNYSQR